MSQTSTASIVRNGFRTPVARAGQARLTSGFPGAATTSSAPRIWSGVGNGKVAITLPATMYCQAGGTVYAADGKKLSHTTITEAGPQ